MNNSGLKSNILHSCNVCKKTFDKLIDLRNHIKEHKNFNKKTNKISQKKNKRRKKKPNKYCNICCKHYSCVGSFKVHMKTYHDDIITCNSLELKKTFVASRYKKKSNIEESDIFTEFEDDLPSELKNDQFRCKICDLVSSNAISYAEHEKSHYQMTIEKNDNDNSNNPILIDNNMTSNSNNDDHFNGILCDICLTKFSLVSDYEEHHTENCRPVKYNDCKKEIDSEIPYHNSGNVISYVSFNKPREIVVLHKVPVTSEVLENRMKVLNDLSFVPQQFECEMCHDTCNKIEHLEYKMWWSLDNYELLECSVCYSRFLDENNFKLHQNEHLNQTI